MKLYLALIFSGLMTWSTTGWTGPGDGPVVPWPTKSLCYDISLESVKGSWFAFAHNSVWHIEIAPVPENREIYQISIYSQALFKKQASGLLTQDDKALVGIIHMDEEHVETILIYRDTDGTKLRIQNSDHSFSDIKLYYDALTGR